MSGLDAIKVRVEADASVSAQNALPVLNEIRFALDKLASDGENTVIDLSAIPFSPGDRERLFNALGVGEVDASVNALGETRIRETGYPGVWLVEHHAPQGEPLATHIEVTRTPSLLITPEQDVRDSAAALAEKLEQEVPEQPGSQ